MNMKKIVFTEIGKAELWDADVSAPGAGEVLVEIGLYSYQCRYGTGICMRLPNTGNPPNGPYKPMILGYSGSGIVKAIGEV